MMLFNIITGFHKPIVKQYPKDEIIVVRCLIQDLSVTGKFFFTDGQANEKTMTKHYNDLKYLSNIDWDIIQQSDFKRTSIDTDKTRRYQAEFLMHEQVSVGNIESLHVYNEKAVNFVKQEMAKTNALIPIHITKQYFFD